MAHSSGMRACCLILDVLFVLGGFSFCTAPAHPLEERPRVVSAPAQGPADSTLLLRFHPPPGFGRARAEDGSFASFLRQLPLKPPSTPVRLYNRSLKSRQDAHAAVIDMSVGDKDLQQCADAIMRLRAEYLFSVGRSDEIAFDFTNGFRAEWNRWRKGERIKVAGNTCLWVQGGTADDSHDQLMRYMEMVFTYAGTLSLQRELSRGTAFEDLQAGDVFIQGGSPGHAIIVLDKAKDRNGRVAFLLAQGFMPAQDMHVVKNLWHPELGAWFILEPAEALRTPEWTFDWSERRSWP
ncbi:MAG: DUF4846 domain-containing protein [Flavobacteriales bacterium]|nr:DUF4846 domain-containing protein [Flavobacteriales bacterium]